MPDLTDDAWVISHSPIEAEKLHALGFITLAWNGAEIALFFLFAGATGLNGRLAWALTHEMGDVSMCNRIKDILPLGALGVAVTDAILHSIELYDRNRMNRNQLSHFMPSGGKDGIEFWRKKGPEIKPQPFASELKDIRRVGDEIISMQEYMTAVGNHLSALFHRQQPKSLPEKPPLPERLWTPPPPDPKGRKRPLQSSQG